VENKRKRGQKIAFKRSKHSCNPDTIKKEKGAKKEPPKAEVSKSRTFGIDELYLKKIFKIYWYE
jgi:hypothetical protein